MAGKGPAPKETLSRERDQRRRDAQAVSVAPDGELRGPDLPEGIDWPDVTLDWWDTWRRSPMAQTFTDTDWSFLLDTAQLHMRFWDGESKVAGELRLRQAKFGATPEDRARLKINITAPATGTQPTAVKAKAKPAPRTRNRKDRILKSVDGAGAS